jgi:hypothetical protein
MQTLNTDRFPACSRWGDSYLRQECLGGTVQPNRLRLPEDLRDWIPADVLLLWLGEELTDLPALVETRSETNGLPAGRLVGLLAFAYTAGALETHTLLHRCATDPVFRFLGGNEPPSRGEIARFRFKNRDAIVRVLTGLLLRAVKRAGDRHHPVSGTETYSDLRNVALERVNTARHLDAAED